MKNLVPNKEQHYKNYSNAVESVYNTMRWGISGCSTYDTPYYLSEIRKQIVDWQSNEDFDALCGASITYKTWLPITYETIGAQRGGPGWLASHSSYSPLNVNVGYNYGINQSENLIQINAGGCITHINLNPVINIDNSSGANYVHVQTVADNVWTIVHNLEMVPNVFIQNELGQDIVGDIEIVDNNTLTITFSQNVAGTAYLS